MLVREIQTRSVITKSNIPSIDYVINPYTGCSHGCVYCYARFMKYFSCHKEPWGQFVDVKINAPDTIPTKSIKYVGKTMLLASVTDPYLPLEKKYELTRKILERLIPLQPDLSVLTKSDLVVRDIDLLKQFKNCEVGLTITTADNKLRQEVEPLASSLQQRISALEALHKAGITTYVFVSPILPFITDWKTIVEQTKHVTNYYMFDGLNMKGAIWASVRGWLMRKHPNILKQYAALHANQSLAKDFWTEQKKEVEQYCLEQNLSCIALFDWISEKKKPSNISKQKSIF